MGAYGVVYKVVCKESNTVLALKKNFDCYRVASDAQRTYREVVFLKAMRQYENIVKLVGVYSAENKKDLYLTFEYMPTDLHVVIRSNILNEVHMQYITYQILRQQHFDGPQLPWSRFVILVYADPWKRVRGNI